MRLQRRSLLLAIFVSGVGTGLTAQPARNEVEVNGFTMTYVEEGTGEPIIFVHGAVADARAWEPIWREASGEHRYIAPTLRYHGAGEWPDEGGNYNIETHADDVAAFIEALDLGSVHLVGWSSGGDIGATMAMKNPDLIRSLILFEGAPWNLVEQNEANAAAWGRADQMFAGIPAAVDEGEAEKATRLLIDEHPAQGVEIRDQR